MINAIVKRWRYFLGQMPLGGIFPYVMTGIHQCHGHSLQSEAVVYLEKGLS